MKMISSLQVYRGLAALMVVLHHFSTSVFGYNQQLSFPAFQFLGTLGKYGVDFFFVLSGFIIAYSTHNKRQEKNALRHYLFNRWSRIFVPYWPIGIAMLCAYLFLPSFANTERNISILTSTTLFPKGEPALHVAWSLTFELMFYFLFCFNFIGKKIWHAFAIIWAMAIVFVMANGVSFSDATLAAFFSAYNLEFLLGYMVCYLFLCGYKPAGLLLVFGAVLTLCAFVILEYNKVLLFPLSSNLVFAIFAALLIAYSIHFLKNDLSQKNIWFLLGNASYSVYLVHYPLQALLLKYFRVTTPLQLLLLFLITTFVCCAAGYVYYLVFEKYILRKIKSVVQKNDRLSS